MNRKVYLLMSLVLAVSLVYFSSFTSAALELTVNAKINNVSTDFSALTNPDANSAFDGFDLEVPNTAPSGAYAEFYSDVSGKKLVIDSWPESPNSRTLKLVYRTVNPAQSGNLVLSWDSISGYNAVLKDYGYDSNYTTLNATKDMTSGANNYNVNTNTSSRYFTLEIANKPDNPPETTTNGPSGPSGPSGPTATLPSGSGLSANPSSIHIIGVTGKSGTQEVTVKNNGASALTFSITASNLPAEVKISPESLTLDSGKTGKFTVDFTKAAAGAYIGKIILVAGGATILEIPTIADIASQNTLFDVKVSIPNQNRYLLPGEDLVARVTIKKVGSNAESRINAYYVIKSFNGNTVYEGNESVDVGNAKDYQLKIPTTNLPLGEYALSVQVVSGGAFASSSAQFSIVNKKPFAFYWIWLGIIVVLVVAVLVGIIYIVRKRSVGG